MSTKSKRSSTNITAPREWPGAFKLYKFSKEAMLVNWQIYLGVLALAILFSFVVETVFSSDKGEGYYLLGQLVSTLLGVYISAVTTVVLFRNLRRKKIAFSEALSEGLKYYLPFIIMSATVYLALVASLLLLVVPFFFVLPRLLLTPYFLVGDDMEPLDAVKASWDQTKGHSMKVWGIIGVNVAFALLLLTIIGIPFALYFMFMYSAASALLYGWIKTTPKAKQQI